MTAGERVEPVVGTTAGVRTALDAAVEHLRGRQHEDGWWKGLLATNVPEPPKGRRDGPVEKIDLSDDDWEDD